MQFTFDIKHVPGSTNVAADMLSRHGQDDDVADAQQTRTTTSQDATDDDEQVFELDVVPDMESKIVQAQKKQCVDDPNWSKPYHHMIIVVTSG